MKGMGICCILLLFLAAGGCGKRELEDRSFPSVLLVADADLETAVQTAQQESSLYIDFGYTKAALIDETVLTNRSQFKEALLYLEQRPDFARNLLLFCADEKVRELADQNQPTAGSVLEDLYKNQPREQREEGVTLQDALNYLHNCEEELEIPCLGLKKEEFIRKGAVTLTWEENPGGVE